jgi:hypothetical protein
LSFFFVSYSSLSASFYIRFGTPIERLKIIFELCDLDGDGVVSLEDIVYIFTCLFSKEPIKCELIRGMLICLWQGDTPIKEVIHIKNDLIETNLNQYRILH